MTVAAIDRWRALTVAVVVVVVPLVFLRAALDDFGVGKATVCFVAAIVIMGLSVTRWFATGRIEIRDKGFAFTATAFALTAILTAALSPVPGRSFFGQYGRWTGAVPYLSYITIGLATMAVAGRRELDRLIVLLAATNGVATVYAIIQMLGLDPFEWVGGRAASTLGNVDFLSGYLAMTLPAVLILAFSASRPLLWRSAAAALALATAYVITRTAALGIVAAAAAVAVLLAVILLERSPRAQATVLGRGRVMALVAVGLAAAAIIVGALLWDPVGQRFGTSVLARQMLWEVAVSMWAERPVLGQGFDLFGTEWIRFQPAEYQMWISGAEVDSPHNVPLTYLSGGGILVFGAYVAVVAVIVAAAWRGLRDFQGQDRLRVGVLAAVWTGYFVQSLASIDVPPIAVMQWVVAGMLVGFTATPGSSTSLVLSSAVPSSPARKPGAGARKKERLVSVHPVAGWPVATVAAAIVWVGFWPLRADVSAANAVMRAEQQQPLGASLERFARAQELAPWEGRYWHLEAEARVAHDQLKPALAAELEAAERSPGHIKYFANAAELARMIGDVDAAEALWEKSLRRNPGNPELHLTAARFFEATGRDARALELVEEAVEIAISAYERTEGSLGQPGTVVTAVDLLAAWGYPEEADRLSRQASALGL